MLHKNSNNLSKDSEIEEISVGGRNPGKIDQIIGQNLKKIRNTLGISQSVLGLLIGVTTQQIQKYEQGSNAIKASVLWYVSKEMGVAIDKFFQGISYNVKNGKIELRENNPIDYHGNESNGNKNESDSIHKESLNLIKNFSKIKDKEIRSKVIAIIKTMADKD